MERSRSMTLFPVVLLSCAAMFASAALAARTEPSGTEPAGEAPARAEPARAPAQGAGMGGAAATRPDPARDVEVVQVADGVHVFIHPDATESWPQGNTVVIEGDRGLVVVDSAYLPSTARADIGRIRKLTSKPVRYLLNTHWHYDHNLGNSVYLEAFPQAEIIAHEATRRIMNARVAGYPARVLAPDSQAQKDLKGMRETLASAKSPAGEPLSEEGRVRLERDVAAREAEMAEFKTFEYQAPTLTFDQDLTLYMGGREVQIRHLYRGNTPGDAFVYLPGEKILITGDLLVSPIPFAFNSYPSEWIRTLQALAALDARVIVSGHGAIQRDGAYLREVAALLESVVDQVRQATERGLRLDDARKAVDVGPFRLRMTGDDKEKNDIFNEVFLTPIVERAYQEATGQL